MSSIIQNKFHEILKDGARPSKFNFSISHRGSSELADVLTYTVKSAVPPKIEHVPINLMHKGRPIPIRGTTKFSQTFTVTFYLSENHINKRFFESWIANIEQRHYYYNPRKEERSHNSGSGGLPDFATWYNVDAWLEQRNFDGDAVTAVYEIKNVFPIDVSAPNFDHSAVGSINDFTVTFACSHYKLHSRLHQHGSLPNQLFQTFQKSKEYGYDVSRFKTFNHFHNLDQTEAQRMEVYWRPYELARWDNLWNRWRENNGANKNPGKEEPSFNPDTI